MKMMLRILAALLFISTVSAQFSSWTEATEPTRIAGPIYYVGTKGLSVFLITTTEGHILLEGATPISAEGIEKSIEKMGFKVADIRFLLTSQAHFDHVGTTAHFKRRTGAKVVAMKGDDALLESGGKKDYLFANHKPFHFEEVRVDRVLKDGDEVKLGGVTMTARHTPGHTPGCTTWVMAIEDGGKNYSVVFAGSTTVNPGTRLVNKPSYVGILEDYRRTFGLLESLKPDIFLGAHAEFFGFEEKRKRAATEGAAAYVDAKGYREHLAAQKAKFEKLVTEEKAAARN